MFALYKEEVRRAVPEVPKSPIDKFTIGHAAWGAILAAMGVSFWGTLIASVVFEIVENPIKKHIPQLFPETILDDYGNQVMDTVGVMAGWAMIRSAK